MSSEPKNRLIARSLLSVVTVLAVLLAGCGGGDSTQIQADNTPNLKMDIPASLTGRPQAGTKDVAGIAAAGTSQPCAYIGEDEDPFRNGYKMTKFLVSAIATWSCIADLLIDVSNFVAHDGAIHETDNDFSSTGHDPKDPTHYSVTDDSDSQTTVRLYYAYDRKSPPEVGEDPQFYVSWNESADDVLEGRIVVDVRGINNIERKDEDPTMLRMDFLYTAAEKNAEMFLRFGEGNRWAEGFRIDLVKDMNANQEEKVYVARGRIEMKEQFLPAETIPELPTIDLFTVSNRAGMGAAVADIQDMSLPLDLGGSFSDNHLGNYLFSKNDTYLFDEKGESDWIYKFVPVAVYRGGRNTPETGGQWPFDPSLDMIRDALSLTDEPDNQYFLHNSMCVNSGDDCTQLIESIFNHHEEFAGQEHNQGSDPSDWRSDAITNPVPLESVYPNGVDWNGAFDFNFVPTT